MECRPSLKVNVLNVFIFIFVYFSSPAGHLFKPVDFKTLVLVELEMANILHQCFESLRAAKVIYECMRALEDASVLLEHDATR